MPKTKRRIDIVGGPQRKVLFDALEFRRENRQVMFMVNAPGQPQRTFSALVNGIEAEDGSGNCWNLKLRDDRSTLSSPSLVAFFNTDTLHGWVQPAG